MNHRNKRPLEERFWKKVMIIPFHECWEWTGCKDTNGYGMIRLKRGPQTSAHRVSWGLHFGEIPIGLNVLHKCDNPGCVRPDHLFMGTHQDNMTDRTLKRRGFIPHGDKRGNLKLSDEEIAEIRLLYETKRINQTELAIKFGVSYRHVWKITHYRVRKNV